MIRLFFRSFLTCFFLIFLIILHNQYKRKLFIKRNEEKTNENNKEIKNDKFASNVQVNNNDHFHHFPYSFSSNHPFPITDMAYVCLCANKKAIYPTLVLWFQLCSIRAKAPFVALVDDHMMNGEDFNLLEPLIDSGIKLRRFGDNGIDKMKKGIEKQDMEKRKNSSLPSFKLSYNVTKGSTRKRDTILWNKLYAWTMTEFKKLIFLDNDLLLLDNFDELFGENELSGVPISFPDEKIIFWNFNNTPIGKRRLHLIIKYFVF